MGLAQCVFILVYIASRSWRSSRSIIPFLYFLLLGGLFYAEFSYGFLDVKFDYFEPALQVLWLILPLLSYLFIIQIIKLEKLPSVKHYWVLALIAVGFSLAYYGLRYSEECADGLVRCETFYNALIVIFIVFSSIAVSVLFIDPQGFRAIRLDKEKKDRYWLALTIIIINTALIAVILSKYTGMLTEADGRYIRIILGVGYVYLATTSLFRIYPPSIPIEKVANPDSLSASEKKVIADIEKLMTMDKLYQEPSFSRADLARELNISEGVITKVINAHYGKSFPSLVNEARVKEAQHLLADTDVTIKAIAEDVGFNSIATFNRVFKDIVGETASNYRAAHKKEPEDVKPSDSDYILG